MSRDGLVGGLDPGATAIIKNSIDSIGHQMVTNESRDSDTSLPSLRVLGMPSTLRILQRLIRSTLRVMPRGLLVLLRLSTVLMLVSSMLLVTAPASLGMGIQAQDSPYLPETPPQSDTSLLLQPLSQLPVWVRAALFSALVAVISFVLIEAISVARSRWQERSNTGRHQR